MWLNYQFFSRYMKRILLYSFIVFLLAGCAKEASDEFVAYPNNPQNDTSWKASIANDAPVNALLSLLSSPPVADSFEISTGGILHCAENAVVIFPANCTKEAVAGKITVEASFLKSKGDMVRFGKPTVSNNAILVSGGAFYIKITKGGQVLHVADDVRIVVKYASQQADKKMKVFYGDTSVNATDGFNWVAATDSSRIDLWQDGQLSGYNIFPKNIGWINCDRFADSSMPSTKLNAILPVNFTNANTAVFVVFKDQWSVLRMSADVPNRYFYAHKIPLNKNVTLVSISLIGNDLYIGAKDVVVSPDAIIELQPVIKSKKDIIDFLAAL